MDDLAEQPGTSAGGDDLCDASQQQEELGDDKTVVPKFEPVAGPSYSVGDPWPANEHFTAEEGSGSSPHTSTYDCVASANCRGRGRGRPRLHEVRIPTRPRGRPRLYPNEVRRSHHKRRDPDEVRPPGRPPGRPRLYPIGMRRSHHKQRDPDEVRPPSRPRGRPRLYPNEVRRSHHKQRDPDEVRPPSRPRGRPRLYTNEVRRSNHKRCQPEEVNPELERRVRALLNGDFGFEEQTSGEICALRGSSYPSDSTLSSLGALTCQPDNYHVKLEEPPIPAEEILAKDYGISTPGSSASSKVKVEPPDDYIEGRTPSNVLDAWLQKGATPQSSGEDCPMLGNAECNAVLNAMWKQFTWSAESNLEPAHLDLKPTIPSQSTIQYPQTAPEAKPMWSDPSQLESQDQNHSRKEVVEAPIPRPLVEEQKPEPIVEPSSCFTKQIKVENEDAGEEQSGDVKEDLMLPRLRTDADVRICILYEYRLGRSVETAHDNLLRAFGARQITDDIVSRWFNKFRRGDEIAEYERSFVPVNIAELMQIVEKTPKMPVPELARRFGVNSDRIYSCLMNIRDAESRKRHGNRELLEVKRADTTAPRISSTVEHSLQGDRLVIRSSETDRGETSEAKCSRLVAPSGGSAGRFEPTIRRLGASDGTASEDKSSTYVDTRTPVEASSAFTEDGCGSIGRNVGDSKDAKITMEPKSSSCIEQVDCKEK